VRRHLAGAHLDQALAPTRRIRRVQLVDRELGAVRVASQVGEQVAEEAVGQPGLRRLARRDAAVRWTRALLGERLYQALRGGMLGRGGL